MRDEPDAFDRIARVIEHVDARMPGQPTLDELAAVAGLDRFGFARLFKQWAGTSPVRFMHGLTVAYAKARLRDAPSVLDATFDAGLSSPGRLHDLMVTFEAVTPGEHRRGGAGVTIRHGTHDTPLGRCFLAVTPRGVCRVAFVDADDDDAGIGQLQRDWPRAELVPDDDVTAPLAAGLLAAGPRPHLHVRGTNFQIQVWRALLAIPPGRLVAYQHVAAAVGRPAAVRAVAAAIGRNPVAPLIPCHRVIARTAAMQGYRWGLPRKRLLIAHEAATRRDDTAAEES